MKHKTLIPILGLALCATMLPSVADHKKGHESSDFSYNQSEPGEFNKMSSLIGMKVCDQYGEKFGTVRDMVIDFPNDKVDYVVVSASKESKTLYAVPLTSFEVNTSDNELILNVDREQLSHVTGFEESTWPNVRDPIWRGQPFWLDRAGVAPVGESAGASEVVPTGRETVAYTEVEIVEIPAPTGRPLGERLQGEIKEMNKASCLIGTNVRNQQGEKLGDIKDMVVNLESEKVAYAVLDYRGKHIQVPLSAFSVPQDEKYLILDATREQLDSYDGFPAKDWPDVNNPDFPEFFERDPQTGL